MALIGYTLSAAGVNRLRREARRRRLQLGEILWDRADDAARPKWADVMAKLQNGEASGIMLLRLSRVAPSLLEVLRLAELVADRELALHVITDGINGSTRVGRQTTRMLADLSRWYREQHSMVTRRSLTARRRSGAVLGVAPFGWQKVAAANGTLTAVEPVPAEQAVIATVRRLRRGDHGQRLTQQAIADRLTADGVPTRSGGPWSRRSVQCLLNTPETWQSQPRSTAA